MILLDTHIVLWLAFFPTKLTPKATEAIKNARDDGKGLAIAAVTLYEIATLAAKGRIDLGTSPDLFIYEVENQFIVKPITGRICAETMKLPDAYPKDPMDRMIGATAIAEGLSLITADTAIQRSKAVDTVW